MAGLVCYIQLHHAARTSTTTITGGRRTQRSKRREWWREWIRLCELVLGYSLTLIFSGGMCWTDNVSVSVSGFKNEWVVLICDADRGREIWSPVRRKDKNEEVVCVGITVWLVVKRGGGTWPKLGRWENDDANREEGVVCLLIGKRAFNHGLVKCVLSQVKWNLWPFFTHFCPLWLCVLCSLYFNQLLYHHQLCQMPIYYYTLFEFHKY